MSQTTQTQPQPAGGSAGRRIYILDGIAGRVREAGKIELARLAQEFGYSLHYFKQTILKEVRARHREVKVVKEGDVEYAVWEASGE